MLVVLALTLALRLVQAANAIASTKDDDDKCPPVFNCNLANFECKQFSACNEFTGQCECLDGFGGPDCSEPLCGGLQDGRNRPLRPSPEEPCDCEAGWGGINCNLCLEDSVCDSFVPGDLKGTCYQSGIIVNKFHQLCNVTNAKILQILNGDLPQVTFSCNKTAQACDFQFWIQEDESFYCGLSDCNLDYDLAANTTHYRCDEVSCKCLAGKTLCGKSGSIDISDFLVETIKGPADFSCSLEGQDCKFSEPSMNDLIQNVFGDPYITLHCQSGECLHKSEIPGFDIPHKRRHTSRDLEALAIAVVASGIIIIASVYGISKSPLFSRSPQSPTLGDDNGEDGTDGDSFLQTKNPVVFSFDSVSYEIDGKEVLQDSMGSVNPGECLAIMGGSGAGKTTLLDILSGKNKTGSKTANLYLDGEKLTTKKHLDSFSAISGFVDQEDCLIPTLTVYETVLNSALLRLPRDMSTASKKIRVLEILSELRILHIKDKVIGSDFERGISGGEKRRVSIACELVTSPSFLFLDEPTSGLDAFNAHNVIECLVKLARDFNRTIIFTIHQPRSNIVALFDKLILLADGYLVYSGQMGHCNQFFLDHGYKCPTGYNIADFLVDITTDERVISVLDHSEENDIHKVIESSDSLGENLSREWEHYAVHREEYQESPSSSKTKRKIHKLFTSSSLYEQLKSEIEHLHEQFSSNGFKSLVNQERPKGATFVQQLLILCSRTFKNTYRNPRLLLSHYVLSITMGLFCSYLYYDVANDISGFQNRLGLFFFLLTMFGFSSLTGLHIFSIERIVFIRERANQYYHPLSYYLSKMICDVVPLRIFPPLLLMVIIYPLVGLNMDDGKFQRSLLIMVLFNLATSIEVFIIGIVFEEPGAATMVGVLVMLFSLLFAGLFINKESIPVQINWFQNLSVFHYGYEALTVNEVNGLMLREHKYGLDIQVPGAVILSTFGFDVGALNIDIISLAVMFGIFVILGYAALHTLVYERR
ncbi:Putative ATP-dependent permease [Komagataella phaffii CBS 7435]|uniref:ATP-dependent permease of the ABC transporter family of proteins n=2 Tax=Komagataella phaffii TaxID=460519 RepID=C4R610_KOMPG|nr:uncharacterized protein PAS_chr3_0935 [Komagataella phaffii GS115]AOA64102.1 GQ67_04064T0 [Komagataella phaffii]CAH2449185.1 Putative ATP-dependent permease [Komagataella phaffii CBS 7435]AOA69365.1 GQ68_04037T0 [Komagataella phaffii GS115]CAY70996.1 Putative ATP-dependent permease of the ABC transporter family of proteins [Komagataella phaffii GS115]CCA39207.2 Putative ATP-dependent permease [Komagataella phaffii CBS 7435]